MDAVILGTRIDALTLEQVLQHIHGYIHSDAPHYLVTPNPEILVAASRDAELRAILNHADLSVADGVGVMLAARWLGTRLPQRLPGADLVYHLAELAAAEGWSVYLLGGQGSTPAQAAQRLRQTFPSLRIAGVSNAQIDDPRHAPAGVIERIAASHADLLLVGLGGGKQERFMYYHLDQLPRVRLAVGVGGSLDFFAGRIPRAPRWLRAIGAEWLYRLIRQPSRWRRIATAVIQFPWLVLKYRHAHV